MLILALVHVGVVGIVAGAIAGGRAARRGDPGGRLLGALSLLAAFEISYPLPMACAALAERETEPVMALFGLGCALAAQPIGLVLSIVATMPASARAKTRSPSL